MKFKRTKGGIFAPIEEIPVARPKLVSLEDDINQKFTQLKRSKFLEIKKEKKIILLNS